MFTLQKERRPTRASAVKVRYLIAILGVFCPAICYVSRQNLSIAIVSMVAPNPLMRDKQSSENSTLSVIDQHQQSTTCPAPKILSSSGNGLAETVGKVKTHGPTYSWSVSDRSLVFETFWMTYVIFQIPGARLAEVLGSKWILAGAAFGSALLSCVSPWAASQHVYLFALIRALMGTCQAAVMPASFILYTRWLPPSERRRALPVLTVGVYIGSIVTSAATGYFSENEYFGWPWSFYMPSILCALWGFVWLIVGASNPCDHWFISNEELDYIESMMENKKSDIKDTKEHEHASRKSPSWMKLFTSQGVWALILAFFASNCALKTIFVLLPTYLNDILLIPPFRNGLINSVIYILYIISSPIIGLLSSNMIETKAFGITSLQTRKLFEGIALFGQAACILAIPFIGCQTQLVLGLLYVQIVLFSFIDGGEIQVPSELSSDFAGTIYAITNCIGSSTGFIVPRVHSLIVKNIHDREQWNTFFYLIALVIALCGLTFLVFARNDQQDFSKYDKCNKHTKGQSTQSQV